MSSNPNLIAWIDLETTSLDPRAEILEVGIVLTDAKLEPIASRQWLRSAPIFTLTLASIDPEVLAMHALSGLWTELSQDRENLVLPAIDDDICHWLSEFVADIDRDLKIPAAGSGVTHFDRQLIQRFLPHLHQRLTHWSYDVGVIRRYYENLVGEVPAGIVDTKTHRALDDANAAIAEMRFYVSRILAFRLDREINHHPKFTVLTPKSPTDPDDQLAHTGE